MMKEEQIQDLSKRLETEIHKTPSGELRNLLCDANIVSQQLLSPEIVDCSGLDPDVIKLIQEIVELQREKGTEK